MAPAGISARAAQRRSQDDAGELAGDRRDPHRTARARASPSTYASNASRSAGSSVLGNAERPADRPRLGVEARRAGRATAARARRRRPTIVESTSVAWTHSESSGSRAA